MISTETKRSIVATEEKAAKAAAILKELQGLGDAEETPPAPSPAPPWAWLAAGIGLGAAVVAISTSLF